MAPTTEEPVQKRGRGRPPKVPGEKKVYVPTGRPRGRPKGSGGVQKTTPKKTASTPGRGRGRPRKSDAVEAAVAEATDTPAKKSGTPGRRGRPRKSDASTGAATPKKAETKKGPKGRKSDVSKDASSSPTDLSDGEAKDTEDADADSSSNAEGSGEEVRRWLPSRILRGLFG
ncbi:uncharacterized protein CTRU02_202014 [Colletotrichum truncatum]|uniref:Uncharacterized protein n=1 Tax=Colletotrichum truncatum TaxID=5467 RepID=A0ACC3ZJ10_COLTU